MANLSRSVVLNILGQNKEAKAAVDDINKDADALEARKPTLHITADDSGVKKTISGIEIDLQALRNRTFSIKADADVAPAIFKISGLKAILDSLNRVVATPKIDLNMSGTTGVFAQIDAIVTRMEELNHMIIDPKIDINVGVVEAEIATIRTALDSLKGRTLGVGVDAHGGAGLGAIEAAFRTLQADASTALASIKRDSESTFTAVADGAGGAGGGIRRLAGDAAAGGAAFGAFGGRVGLTTNALHNIIGVAVEVAAVVIPALVALGTYSIFAAKWVGNIGDQFQFLQAATKQTNPLLHQTTAGVLGLGAGFQSTQAKVEPQVYQDLGGALNALKASMHSLTPAVLQVGQVFNNFFAKLVIDLRSQQFGGLVKFMVFDLKELGAVLGNLGHAFLNIASALPHFAEVLLLVANAIATVIRWISELPKWVIVSAVAFEEFNRWGGMLVGLMGRMGIATEELGGKFLSLSRFGAIFRTLATSPLRVLGALSQGIGAFSIKLSGAQPAEEGFASRLSKVGFAASNFGGKLIDLASKVKVWQIALVVAAAVGIGFLIHWMLSGETAAQQFSDKIMASAENVKNVFQAQAFLGGIIKLQNQLHASEQTIRAFNNETSESGKGLTKLTGITTKYTQSLVKQGELTHRGAAAYIAAEEAARTYQQALSAMVTKMIQTEGAGARLAKTYGTTIPQAQMIAQQAGVNLAKSIDNQGRLSEIARVKIQDLVAGYKAMGIQGGLLGNTMTALSTQINIQDSKVQQVNQAWSTFIHLASDVETGFVGVLQNVRQMGPSFQLAAAGGNGLNKQLQQLAHLPAGGGLGGISDAALNLRMQFQQGVTGADQFFGSLRTGFAATGAGVKGFQQLKTIVAGTIAQYVPFVGANKAAQQQLIALGKEGGFVGTSFKGLLGWINQNTGALTNNGKASINSQGAVQKLSNLVQLQEQRFADLTKVAQQYANTMQTDFINAITAGQIKTSGFTQQLNKVETVIANHGGIKSFAAALQGMDQSMRRAGASAATVRVSNVQLEKQFGLTARQAADLNNYLSHLTSGNQKAAGAVRTNTSAVRANGQAIAQYKAVRAEFATDLARAGVSAARAHALLAGFTNEIRRHGSTTAAYKQAREQMIKDLERLGLTASQARTHVATLTAEIKRHGQAATGGHAGRMAMNKDIQDTGTHSRSASPNVRHLADETRRHGTASGQYHGARSGMNKDIEETGQRSRVTATELAKLTNDIRLSGTTVAAGHGPRIAMVQDLQKINIGSEQARGSIEKLSSSVKLLDSTITSGHAPRGAMISDLQKINQVAQTTRTLITNLTDAIKLNNSIITQGHSPRTVMITDIQRIGQVSITTKNLIDQLTASINRNTQTINTGHGPRTQFTTDLRLLGSQITTTTNLINRMTTSVQQDTNIINAGHGARTTFINDMRTASSTATTLTNNVNALTRAINAIPKNTQINIKMTATGSFTVSQGGTPSTPSSPSSTPGGSSPPPPKHAAGWKVPGHGNEDNVAAMLMPGEAVVPKHLVPQIAPFLAHHGVPGFEAYHGQKVPHMASGLFSATWKGPSMAGEGPWLTKDYNTMLKDEEGVLEQDLKSALTALANGPLGGATGSELQNGRELYQYLLANVFGGNKIAAAGATASIWGESTWNPFAQGTGGRGLIGWTPPGTISNAAFSGGMRTQLPAIIQFINSSGDWGVIQRMKSASSVSQAAWEWGIGVERFGIPDVHPQGIALATSFMANGGIINEPVIGRGLSTGIKYAFGERGPEMITPMTGPNAMRSSGGNVYVTVQGDTDPDSAALRIWQKLKDYRRRHGQVPMGLG